MEESQKIHKRKPLYAFLLSFAAPGLGQVYNGQLSKALASYLAIILSFLTVRFLNLGATFYGYASFVLIVFSIRVYLIINAYSKAKNLKEYRLKKFNNELFYIGYFVVFMGLFSWLVYSGFSGIKSYSIPTTHNNPTIRVGDLVAMNKDAYSSKDVQCGDFVVYIGPDGGHYTSRVVGLPGDTISILKNTIAINGKRGSYRFIKNEKTEDKIKVARYEEVLPNGVKHHIYMSIDPRNLGDSTKQNMDVVVPESSYFIMGDNRDGALDSRFIGPIPKENILGQLVYVFWGKKGKRINTDLMP
jgi:signal peptidase I